MLTRLAIRNVVLIDKLDLEFAPGLAVLTGETGAGKSIVLDALGLALGLGFGIALCLLCVCMLIFFIRRKREAPAAPQIVLPPPGAGDDGRASIGRAYYEQHGMTMTEAIRNKV